MDLTILHNEPLTLIYEPGRGAWTYRIDVPDTWHLKAPWGSIKVTGTIDDIPFGEMNLMPLKNEDAMMSVNKQLREKSASRRRDCSCYHDIKRRGYVRLLTQKASMSFL